MMEILEPMLTEEELAVTKEEGMPILQQWQNMQRWQITAELQDLRL